MPYVAQLLPDLEQARVIRDALGDYVLKEGVSDEDKDAAWSVLAELTKKMREKR